MMPSAPRSYLRENLYAVALGGKGIRSHEACVVNYTAPNSANAQRGLGWITGGSLAPASKRNAPA